MSRESAALIGGMDRQTLRDWVHAFNARGLDGSVNGIAPGAKAKLSPGQQAEIAALVEAGPDLGTDRVVRWRSMDRRRIIKARYAIDLDEISIGRLLKAAGFRISVRDRSIPTRRSRYSRILKKLQHTRGRSTDCGRHCSR